jgi:hypothetical protein
VRTLKWEDTFFDQEDGLVAVFDFDYDKIASFKKSAACVSMLFPPVLILGTLFCYPCFYRQQVDWDVYSQHVAITRDGIKFVKDRRKTGCGLSCTDAGKSSKTVPFDKLTGLLVPHVAASRMFSRLLRWTRHLAVGEAMLVQLMSWPWLV